MKDWNYGGFAADFDMTQDKIEIGTGLVKVHDIMEPRPEWLKGQIVFCDPPCSQGNLQAFATKADKGTLPEGAYINFEERLKQVFNQIDPHVIYLELFASNRDSWCKYLKNKFGNVCIMESFYYNKPENKCWIAVGYPSAYRQLVYPLPWQDEAKNIKLICQFMPSNFTICDPCMGLGLVGYWANFFGKKFTGTELNANRLAYLLARIKQQTITPKKSLDLNFTEQ